MSCSTRSVRVGSGWALALALLALCSFLIPAAPAHAGTLNNWTTQPKGTTSGGVPIIVQGWGVPNGFPLVASTVKLLIDGATVPRPLYTATANPVNLYVYYSPQPVLTDGLHTFRVEIKDTAAKLSYYEWTATVRQAPTATWISPAAGLTLYNGHPAIVLSLADNTPSTTFAVAGAVHAGTSTGPVVATFGGSGLSAGTSTFTLANELATGAYSLTATVTDAAGNVRMLSGTSARNFTLATLPAMTVLESCDDCHATMRTAHPTPVMMDCMTCHPDYDGDHMQGTDYCEDCHWDGWHTGGAGFSVAVSSKCTDCHSANRPAIPRHTAQNTVVAHDGACGGCHSTSLVAKHAVTPQGSSYAYQCDLCHGSSKASVKAAIAAGDTACSSCHASDYHSGFAAKHVAPNVPGAGGGIVTCVDAGCHQTTSLVDAHAAYVGVGGRYPQYPDTCALCHQNQTPGRIPAGATSDCATCHPERVVEHGYDASKHTSTEACLLTCHSAELQPAHAAQVTAANVVCANCHPVAVDPIKPWNRTCGACHPTITHSTADHVGTDAVVRADRGGNGCSDTSQENLNCHDISNVSALHSGMPNKGCALCHGAGKTPTRECRTCHPKNDPVTSQAFTATYYPSADGPIVGTTTASSGTSLWDKVDESATDGDSTYFQFTTSGSAMFNTARAIPTSATITSVVVYARARSTSSTTRNYYPMVRVGGTPYQRTATNIGISYTTGAGVAYSLTTNPKTGAAWTPADLNSTGGANTLDYFGVGTSNVSGTVYLRVTQCNMVVNYTLPVAVAPGTLLGGTWYHHNNVKYLFDAADAAPGAYYAANPAHGWNDALYSQDCYDFCHRGTATGPAEFTAYQGDRMWYTTAGAYFPEVRTLTLDAFTVPANSPKLDFMTNWAMSGTDRGYVEISTDGGASFTPITGTVGGVSTSSLAGTSASWVPASYALAAYAGQSVKLRFRFVVNDGAIGWAFDNLAIKNDEGTIFSDDAETLSPEWTNYHWTRSNGAYPFF